ncbi:MAG: TonB-dependent receptor [Planctomycetaceae bacterium]
MDFDLLQTPRFDGFESHGATSFDYDTNGQQVYGRQSLWGGSNDWGYRVSYGHRTGNDYRTGAGTKIPASYKSRDLFVALGWDSSQHQHFEFNYLRLDQTDLEFPGLVYDLNFLVTDGFELKYVDTAPRIGDRVDTEFWYNATRFAGDTRRSGKAFQIPNLTTLLYSPGGNSGWAVTDANGSSSGYRHEVTFGQIGDSQTSFGADLTYVTQALNDIEPLIPDVNDNNFPIPPSHSSDVGLFWEEVTPVSENFTISGGARVDFISVNADNTVAGLPTTVSDLLWVDQLQRDYVLWSLFLSGKLQLTEAWSATLGAGHGQRPPTLTELYVNQSFIGSLQRGLTALGGDPDLNPERLTQIDFGVQGNYSNARMGAHGYYSWISNMITYDLVSPAGGAGGIGGFPAAAQFVNTDRALLAGFETYAEYDLTTWLTPFGTISYIEGRDLTRDKASRIYGGSRSGVTDRPHEPLPGIPPMETRLGLRFHDAAPNPLWGVEFSSRIVNTQNRVASSLEEVRTPGFTTYDIRGYRRCQNWLFTAGIENLTDKFYREHLDYRSGRGVFRPGINYYSGVEVTY